MGGIVGKREKRWRLLPVLVLGPALLYTFFRWVWPVLYSVDLPVAYGRTPRFSLRLVPEPGYQVQPVRNLTRREKLMTETEYIYRVQAWKGEAGRLSVILQRFHNGDLLFFVASRGVLSQPEPLARLQLRVAGAQPRRGYAIACEATGSLRPRPVWQPVHPDRLPGWLPEGLVFLEGEGYSLVTGPVNLFRDLGHGVVKEVSIGKVGVHAGRNASLYEIPLQGWNDGESRVWGVLSEHSLVEWNARGEIASLQRGELSWNRKFWRDGSYDPIPSSYVPSHPRGYWRCPAQHIGRLFAGEPGRYAAVITLSSMYSCIRTQNQAGYWPTTPKSTWLAKDYGIGHDFFDTRFNTDGALFLLEAYQKYGEAKALAAAERYARFLCDYARQYSYRTANGGYLVPDYMDPSGRAGTHTALNHLVAEMNFLYSMYVATGNSSYRQVADRMRQAVKDTRDGWIKEDGELWYAYLPNGNFGLKDYPTLTLNDLRQGQELIREITGRPDPDFTRLILAKEGYNRRHGIPLR
ncbi:MAG: hypothetical protein GXX09_04425 [Syntrophomonadaceae bacterium]|nr:hypothetical protein [Syntrophomonadaceae bacterium]